MGTEQVITPPFKLDDDDDDDDNNDGDDDIHVLR
jgi:hypothetical protein